MDLYSILSHPFRRKILLLLEKEGYISYSDLMEKLGLDTTGQLNFHLKKLGSLVRKDQKFYYLSEDGKRVVKVMNINNRILSGENIDDYIYSKGSEISRVGVIICNCNTEISNVINIKVLERYISRLKNVVAVKIFENLCQTKNLDKIKNWVKENFINKIVISACSPKTHQNLFERFFEDNIEHANIEIANIREQCAWVHKSNGAAIDPALVLEKAKLLIEAAVERVVLQKKVKVKRVDIEKSCAILGGGIAGMTLSLRLARAGIKVYLIEKSPTLGGKVARWHRIFDMGDCSICFISELISELVKEKNIHVLTNTEVINISGEVGNFKLDLIKKPRYVDEKKCTACKQCIDICSIEKPNKYEFNLTERKIIYFPFVHCYPSAPLIDEEDIKNCLKCRICERACVNNAINLEENPEKLTIKVGVKVIAIGADLESNLEEYSYNPHNDIITSPEFERILSSDGPTNGNLLKLSDGKPPKTISIIQGVGESEYQSEFNDVLALKYLNSIKAKDPEIVVNIFYDLKKIRKKHKFLFAPMDSRFHYTRNLQIINKNNQNIVISNNKEYISDLIVLNVNMIPNKDLKSLRKKMDFTLNDDGFMSEETLASGVYGVGSVLGPLDYASTMSTTNKVALDIISLLSQDSLLAEFSGIEINEEKCGMCGLCLKACPYNAIIIESERINVDKFKCKGCGTCVSVCPTNAIDMNIDTSEKILTTIKVFSKYKANPKIIAFCCRSCGYAAADDAGLKRISYNPNVFIIQVPCTGRVDTSFILKAFEYGFDGVMVFGCRKGSCRYIDGVEKIGNKIKLLQNILGPENKRRIILHQLNAIEGYKFAEIINSFYNQLKEVCQY
ncbi:MAG: hydrogenase iron-sulfur subunit [Promethearchaeota archaeon]